MLLKSNNLTSSTTNSTQIPSEAGMPENPWLANKKYADYLKLSISSLNCLRITINLPKPKIASYSVICLAGVVGNLMVILASRKPGMSTVSNILITNLALADLTVSVINIPTTATYSLLGHWPFGAVLCKVLHFLLGLTLSASVGTLEAIAVERYWHTVLYTRRKLTVREAFKAIAVIWALSVFIPLPLSVFSKTTMWKQGIKQVTICFEEWPNVKSRQTFTTLVFVLIQILMYCLSLLLMSLVCTCRFVDF